MATKQISLTEAGKLYRHGTREQLLMDLPAHGKRVGIDLTRKVKNQPPDLTAGEFNRGE